MKLSNSWPSEEQLNILINKTASTTDMKSGCKRLVILTGLLGDFDSFEYVQSIIKHIELIHSFNIRLIIIGIGDSKSRQKFCSFVNIPSEYIQVEDNSYLHNSLGLCKGLDLNFSPFVNLLFMCVGVHSPGTIREVLRGYIGDSESKHIFDSNDDVYTGIFPTFKGSLFERAGGKGFLRPFEMATLRLGNMVEVLTNWNIYMTNKMYLTQRGGTFLIDANDKLLYSYRSTSLLGYSLKMSNPIWYLEPYLK